MNKYGCRTLQGAELEQAIAQCTPLGNVWKKNIPRPHGDMPSGLGRRHEDKNAIRGCK